MTGVTDLCKSKGIGAGPNDQMVFFFARGDATEGRVTLRQANIGRSIAVTVAGITGRVDG